VGRHGESKRGNHKDIGINEGNVGATTTERSKIEIKGTSIIEFSGEGSPNVGNNIDYSIKE
jgi:hypothetical protein